MPNSSKDLLLLKSLNLPHSPGCYLMKDQLGNIIYVGKAKNLKLRVSSYFNYSAKGLKTQHLVASILDFDFVLTGTEAEALILENNLIKKFSPKYNIRLRDDKTYPYLEVPLDEPFPRLIYSRKPRFSEKTKTHIFGPFATGTNLRGIIRILNKVFKLRDCSLSEYLSRKTPCLLYQMGQCSAPCVGKISSSEYDHDLNLALSLFKGKRGRGGLLVLDEIKKRMEAASEEEAFEYAAQLRDFKSELEHFLQLGRQENAQFLDVRENIDLVALHAGEEEWDFVIVMIRNGIQLGHKHFHFVSKENLSDFCDLLFAYYQFQENTDIIPEKIIIELESSDKELLEEAFKKIGHDKIKIKSAQSEGRYKELYSLAHLEVMEVQRLRLGRRTWIHEALLKLKSLLSLPRLPEKIECYDVAIWQGKSPTASQIVFEHGDLNKKAYRYYHLEERPEGNNDYAMLKEFLERRIPKGDLPDVMIVDGGLGQVNILREILAEKNIKSVSVAGIAKARTSKEKKTQERLIIPNRKNHFLLSKEASLLRLMVTLRNEAHRFSRVLHHKGEKGRVISSILDEIPGIGEKKKQKILKKLKNSWEELASWDLEKIKLSFDLDEREAYALKDLCLVKHRNHLP